MEEHNILECKDKDCKRCKESLDRTTKSMSKLFWRDMQRELNKKDFEDGTRNTRNQKILRAIYIMHLEVKELQKKVGI